MVAGISSPGNVGGDFMARKCKTGFHGAEMQNGFSSADNVVWSANCVSFLESRWLCGAHHSSSTNLFCVMVYIKTPETAVR
jgi:hypothetical protein